jgi:DMSO/TMAO reductase YedYZ heme-binding membrane subunit
MVRFPASRICHSIRISIFVWGLNSPLRPEIICYYDDVLQNMLEKHKTLSNLQNNSRFYILASSIVLSLALVSWIRITVPGDQLFYIRTEQVYGLASVIYWYAAVIISPLGYIIGKERLSHLVFARRAIGVSAAYFAFLHFAVSMAGQIGGLSGMALLPGRFKLALAFGIIALVVLFLMAATSFDQVITFMTFKRWKWLHRLVYGAGILVILHVWMIGTHAAYTAPQLIAYVALTIFFGMESFRIAGNVAKHYKRLKPKQYVIALFLGLWLFWALLLWSLPGLVKNYHSEHAGHQHSAAQETTTP